MPQFNLLGMKVAEYHNNNGTVTYGAAKEVGDAMTCNLELTFAEGRLYAEGKLAEYLREATGGSISIGVKYIKQAAQELMYGAQTKTRSLTYTPTGSSSSTTKSAVSLVHGANDTPAYVGFVCYAPDMVDKVKKFTCFFVACALFGPPAYNLQTKGQNITFATPTTTGEFQPDDSTGAVIQEIYVADDEAEAQAWCAAVLPTTA